MSQKTLFDPQPLSELRLMDAGNDAGLVNP